MSNPKAGDIFRWSWNDAELKKREDQNRVGTLYWCCSRICVFQDGEFVDTYWGESGSNRSFTVEKANDQICLEYIANFDDLTEADKNSRAYYKDSDCIDISHPNKSRGGFYLRKGAEKSLEKMRVVMARILKKYERDAEHARQRAEQIRTGLGCLKIESCLPTMDGISLSDSSYEDS
jgi:hypothetical protein